MLWIATFPQIWAVIRLPVSKKRCLTNDNYGDGHSRHDIDRTQSSRAKNVEQKYSTKYYYMPACIP